jgi:CubicO group peptidase (beta-lactamase class C family)
VKHDLTPPAAGTQRETAQEITSEDARFSNALDILREGLGETYSAAVLHVRLGGMVVVEASIGTFAPGDRVIDSAAIFDLASLTKLLTGTAMLVLNDRRALALEDPIAAICTEFAGPDGRRQRVTVKHLLTHTSGLPAHVNFRDEVGAAAVIGRVCATPLIAAPGEAVLYSDLGFMLAGEIVARVSRLPLDRAISTLVIDPLGARDVCFLPNAEARERIVCTEDDPWRGRLLRGEVHDENCWAMGGVAGHAGLFGSALDVASLGELYRTHGESANGRVISRAMAMFAVREQAAGDRERRGLAWALKADDAHSCGQRFSATSFGHTGYTGTSLWVDPSRELTVAFLTNRVHVTRDGASILRARGRIHDAIADAVDRDSA